MADPLGLIFFQLVDLACSARLLELLARWAENAVDTISGAPLSGAISRLALDLLCRPNAHFLRPAEFFSIFRF